MLYVVKNFFPDNINGRVCTVCGIFKDWSKFYRNELGFNKKTSRCNRCMMNFSKEWVSNNRDKALEATKRWRLKNPEKVKEQNKKKRNRKPILKDRIKELRLKRLSVDGYREKINRQAVERNKKIKQFLADFKTKSGCIDCGYNMHHSALEFDHIIGSKKINVCLAKSIKQAIEEIKKCEVVCSNCHRIRTYKRLYPCKHDIFIATYEAVE